MSTRVDRSKLPPGPTAPAALQMLATWTRPSASMLRSREQFGKRFTVRLPLQPPFVILSDPGDIKELFMASPEAIHPGEGARMLEPIGGRYSVILLDEAPHMEQRKLMLSAFHGERMRALVGPMTELTVRELDRWPTDEPIRLHSHLQRLTLEIVLQAVFGLEQGPRLDSLRAALTNVLTFSESPLSLMPWARVLRRLPPVRRFHASWARADELVFKEIGGRCAAGESGHTDVLATLLQARREDGSKMSRRELRDELMTTLVASHETTASQLAWAFEQLASAPDVMERLREEAAIGEGDEYLTATINEIMRLRPVQPTGEPRLVKREITIGGVTYPPGVCLLASAFLVHHDPEIYPEPKAFRPERFLGVKPGTYTWLPFGGGRRRCLGAGFALQEMKIVLRDAALRFDIAPGGPREHSARRALTFNPTRGATVILHPRTEAPVPGPAASAA